MLQRSTLCALSFLAACSGGKSDDSGTSDDTDTDDTSTTDVAPIDFTLTFVDGLDGSVLAGAETCVDEPVIEGENCFTTDEDGVVQWTWEDPHETNFVARLTLDTYITTIYSGRYADDVAANWETEIDDTGMVSLLYSAFTTASVGIFLGTGDITQEEGNGIFLFNLLDANGAGVEGAVVTLTDDAGAESGTVHYANTGLSGLDTSLESTSASGTVVVANLAPGIHTATVSALGYACQPWFSWDSDEENVVQLPVEADSMTRAGLFCATDL